MNRIETATEKLLGIKVRAAALAQYPGWFQQQAMRRQFRGPLGFPLRAVVDVLGQDERDKSRAALAAAGLPDNAILAVTEAGLHILTAGGLLFQSPREELTLLPPRSYAASLERRAFTLLLSLELPSGKGATYEGNRSSLPWPRIPAFDAIVATSRTPAQAASTRP